VRGLALGRTAAGPTAYLGLWRWPGGHGDGGAAGPNAAGSGRIVAVRTDTGAVIGAAPLVGAPERLVWGGAGAPAGRRLLCVEELPGPQRATRAPEHTPPDRWQLLLIDPAALQVDAVHQLGLAPRALAVAPDSGHAYLLATLDGPRSVLSHVDLATGASSRIATVSGLSLDVAVTDTQIYVPQSDGNTLLVLDRQRGHVVKSVAVGRRPVGLTLSQP
jgi:hypothetical protein